MSVGLVIGLVAILGGAMLFRHAASIDTANSALHRSLGIVPASLLDRMRSFNIVWLRVAALFWMLIGVFCLILTVIHLFS